MDLGCGTGSFTARFRDQGFDLSAIDISPECIRHAQKKYPSIKFEVGDIEHTRYQDETFDAVFLSGVLHHFPNLDKLLKETRRIVKPGGILIGYDPHKANPIMWLYRCKESPFYSAKGVTANEQPLTKLQINRALNACNFSEQDVCGISGVTYKYVESKISLLLLPVYNLIEKIMDFKLLRNRFGSFLITYAKK